MLSSSTQLSSSLESSNQHSQCRYLKKHNGLKKITYLISLFILLKTHSKACLYILTRNFPSAKGLPREPRIGKYFHLCYLPQWETVGANCRPIKIVGGNAWEGYAVENKWFKNFLHILGNLQEHSHDQGCAYAQERLKKPQCLTGRSPVYNQELKAKAE